ncbi:hypothetical protein [Burkholderia seminalis]|uniref:hypothetical protein n=1 Tax=Burkholderia seminalis TaxID=488731 RepID=UPI002650ED8A|nr:hypothetical protein [Burkholderia seminalis]MDN7588046.1 hypothetical protein [Burkholderia seminalis]
MTRIFRTRLAGFEISSYNSARIDFRSRDLHDARPAIVRVFTGPVIKKTNAVSPGGRLLPRRAATLRNRCERAMR